MKVMVIDDSAVARQLLSGLLTNAGMEVQVAPEPVIAMRKMERFTPDVIVLDLEMPRMDGLTFLRILRAKQSTPVVVCSGAAGERSELALRALEEGATEIVARPRVGLRTFFEESSTLVVDAVLAAAQARPQRPVKRTEPPPVRRRSLPGAAPAVVAIGASTGGTEAIREILCGLSTEPPPIAIVQHMPAGFTAAFASWLAKSTGLAVREAKSGDRLTSGTVLVAPGGRHLRVRSGAGGLVAQVLDGPLVQRHRPSVDVLFSSVAVSAGSSAVGVILTGMGEDGVSGMDAMHRAGARTIAQDETTSAVFGMPKAAIQAGVVDEVVPLGRIAWAITRVAAARVA
jgi:two-component system chemotaxis response regulator CheB